MEAPGNRLLAVHLPVSAICVSKDIVVKKRNEWVISAVPLKDNTLIFFTNLKTIFKFLKSFFLNGSSFFPQTLFLNLIETSFKERTIFPSDVQVILITRNSMEVSLSNSNK